jgi:hypothetical protein
MNGSRADPVVLSERYIEECTNNFTSKELGSGAFGTVYLGTDPTLGIHFAVKRVPLSVPSQAEWDQITLSFKREIAVSHFATLLDPAGLVALLVGPGQAAVMLSTIDALNN